MHVTTAKSQYMRGVLEDLITMCSLRVSSFRPVELGRRFALPGIAELRATTEQRLGLEFPSESDGEISQFGSIMVAFASSDVEEAEGVERTRGAVDGMFALFEMGRLRVDAHYEERMSSRARWILVSRSVWRGVGGVVTRGGKRRSAVGIPTYLPDEIVRHVGQFL